MKTAYDVRISDWSSDVCSSDLAYSSQSWGDKSLNRRAASIPTMRQTPQLPALRGLSPDLETRLPQHPASRRSRPGVGDAGRQIGRASWRERVCQYVSNSVVAGSLKKKTKDKHIYSRCQYIT